MLLLKLPFLAAGPPVEVWESPAEVASTFFALAAVGFMKLDPPPFLWTLVALGFAAVPPLAVLGRVVLRALIVVEATVGAALLDPARLIEFATELRDAPELDLLRFSFELVGRVVGFL